ncbi:unnamed protein product, partial [Oppiella nova]
MDSDTEDEEDTWEEARDVVDEPPVDREADEPPEDDDMTDIEEVDDPDVDNKQQILDDCLEAFAAEDYIMEPGIVTSLGRYFQAGGNPEQVVELLSTNYHAIAQTANLLAEWLIMTDLKISEVQSLVEDHLKQLIIKHFDPKKADSIFSDETTG